MNSSILQISISRGGVPKRAIAEADVNSLGIVGDVQAHSEIHGGPLQALLLVTSEGIEELISQGFSVFAGALGENLTTCGLDRKWLRTGQRYRVGEIIIELTAVREPCAQLNIYGAGIQKAVYDKDVQAGDVASPRWGLSGFYASVVRGGTIRLRDPIQLLEELT